MNVNDFISGQNLLDDMIEDNCVAIGALLMVVKIHKIHSYIEFKPDRENW